MTPDGWRETTLGEAIEVIGGGTPKRDVAEYWNGTIPWATPSDITALRGRFIGATESLITPKGLADSSAKLLPVGAVLMTSRATIGACAIAKTMIATNQGFQNLLPSESLSSEFLLYLVQSLHSELIRRAAGSTFLEISNKGVKAVPVALPPLPEQRKIAAILSSVDEVIEKTEAVIEQLQVVKKAMMQELLTRGIPGRHSRFKQTEIGEIPEEWEVVALGDLAGVFNGKASGTGGTWLRAFKTKHVYDGLLRLDKPEFAGDGLAEKVNPETYLKDGDTLTPNMAHGTIGRVAYVRFVEENWATDGQVMVLRSLDAERLAPRFLFEYISSVPGRRQLLDREKGGIFGEKRGQTHMYPRDVKAMRIPLPEIVEQRAIAAALESLDQPLEANERSLGALETLKTGLMQVLLTGDVRVTPDEEAA